MKPEGWKYHRAGTDVQSLLNSHSKGKCDSSQLKAVA